MRGKTQLNYKYFWSSGLLFLLTWISFVAVADLTSDEMPPKTPFEKSNYSEFHQSSEVNYFLQALTHNSTDVVLDLLGQSVGGRPIYALLLSKDPQFLTSKQTQDNRITVVLVGSQHGSEIAGSEALQIIARDILYSDEASLLDAMNLVVIVDANPDGRDLNFKRYNAAGYDLNRDFILLNQGGSQAIVKALHEFKPHILVDIHEANSFKKLLTEQEGYLTHFDAQFEVSTNPNINYELRHYASDVFLPQLIQATENRGIRAGQYRGTITTLSQPVYRAKPDIEILRNYAGMHGALALLIENRLDPDNIAFEGKHNKKARVDKQVLTIQTFLELVKNQHKQIYALSQLKPHINSDQENENRIFWLGSHFELDEAQPSVEVPFIDVISKQKVTKNLANYGIITKERPVKLPDAYVVLNEHQTIADLLKRHYLDYEVVEETQQLNGTIQHITAVKFLPVTQDRSVIDVEFTEQEGLIEIKPGDLIVKTDQIQGGLLPLMLDPRSSSSIFQSLPYRALLLNYRRFFILPVSLSDYAA